MMESGEKAEDRAAAILKLKTKASTKATFKRTTDMALELKSL